MRLAIVTSEVNYVKDNYQALLERLIKEHRNHLQAIVVVKTINLGLWLKIFFLPFMGAPRLSWILLRNTLRRLLNDPFKKMARQGIRVIRAENINTDACYEMLSALNLDLILNIRTRNIFKKRILALPRWGCLNVHHGLLPEFRGTMCDLWALAEGRDVGYSIHWMNAKIDDGRILKASRLKNPLPKDYSQIPFLSSLQEAEDLIELLHLMEASGPIPGYENSCQKVKFTRNPKFSELRKIRQKGIRL